VSTQVATTEMRFIHASLSVLCGRRILTISHRLVEVTIVTKHLALGYLSLTASFGPRPYFVRHLGRRVDVVEFKVLGRATSDASLVSEELGTTLCFPLAIVFALLLRVFVRYQNSLPLEPTVGSEPTSRRYDGRVIPLGPGRHGARGGSRTRKISSV
jgi:hypothetical protein